MDINKYCKKCDKVWNPNTRFCERCGQSVEPIKFTNNKIHTIENDDSIGELGKKLGKKVLRKVVDGTKKAKQAYNKYNNQKTPSANMEYQSPLPKDKNYRELQIVCNTIKNIGRIIMKISKGIFYLLLIVGAIIFITNIDKGIQIAIAAIIIPLLFGLIICLPIYIVGLIMTALPQIINLIHDIRDNIVEINKKTL